ncbi:hypothetical protein BDM02DRAFT_1875512 [Thelephora ganbajun]|uniref:Uncharacterized protein n=1 Tax=Thelephora ganbajun TaxID=370292 RepID=A0ACB6YZT6_THEGA|nr:hypothetical protein BDM02DRAFT_1875512 [Thelephora ganbajun]
MEGGSEEGGWKEGQEGTGVWAPPQEGFPQIQRCLVVLTALQEPAEGGRQEEVSASDRGRVSSRGRAIGRREVLFPTIAAPASRTTPIAPSIKAYPFRKPGSAHPPPGNAPKTPGRPLEVTQGICCTFLVTFL